MGDRDHARAGRAGHFRRPIRRRIVNDNELVRRADLSGGGVQRRERAAQQLLLVVSGDDERDHYAVSARSFRTGASSRGKSMVKTHPLSGRLRA